MDRNCLPIIQILYVGNVKLMNNLSPLASGLDTVSNMANLSVRSLSDLRI